jgi:signal peptidase II
MDYFYYEYPYGGIGLFKNFFGIELSISHATNTGAAWGILGNHPLILITLRLLLIGGLSIYTFFYNEQKSWQPFLALILAGAIGNVIDFMFYGHVIDMIHLVMWGYDFPVFNIADSAITLAVFALFILSLMNPKPNNNDE